MQFSRKVKVAAGAAAACLAISGAAFAYFTTTGEGEVEGAVGTSTELTITGSSASTLYPGTTSVVSFVVDNPSTGNQFVTTIHLDSVTTSHVDCLGTWFTMPDVNANQDIDPDGEAIDATGTLTMANAAVSQDACKLRHPHPQPFQRLVRRPVRTELAWAGPAARPTLPVAPSGRKEMIRTSRGRTSSE